MFSHTPIGSSLYAHSHYTGERREAEGYTDGSHDFTYKSAGMQLETGADREQNEELLAGGGTAPRSDSIFFDFAERNACRLYLEYSPYAFKNTG